MNRLAMYSPMRECKRGELPAPPFVHIMVGTNSVEAGHILISPELASDMEIDEIVSQLKAELDEFARVAKCELRYLKHETSKK